MSSGKRFARVHRTSLTALTVGALLCSAAPAAAERPSKSALIEFRADGSVEFGGALFASPAALHASPEFREGGFRCGTVEEPIFAEIAPGDCTSGSTTISPDYDPVDVYRIPVVFHILQRDDGAGAITDDLIHSQIEILNEDFRAKPESPGAPGTDARIEFYLATVDPDGTPTTGINRYTNNSWYNDSGNFKSTLRWDPHRYLNIYTNSAGGYLGYATMPQQSAGSSRDGVVLLWSSVGRDAPQGGAYAQGRTGTHEVGHYLGLHHTFNGGCGTGYSAGDRIADTVPEQSAQYECVEKASACGGGNNPIHNYMDYTPDTCMWEFTPEQVNRMRCSLVNYRPNLFEIGEANERPKASFTHTADDLTLSFTDTSTDADGTIEAWSWDFGDGNTSTEQHPTHTYAAEGTYTVELTVTDDGGAIASASAEITVNALPVADFTFVVDGLTATFTDASTDLGAIASWHWDFGDGNTSADQNPVHTYLEDGVFTVTLTVTDDLGATASKSASVGVGSAAPGAEDGDGAGCGCAADPSSAPWSFLALLLPTALLLRPRRSRFPR